MKHRRIRTILMLLLAALLLLSSCSTFVFAAESDAEEGSSLISEKNLKNATNQQSPAAIEEIEKTAKNYDLDKEDKFGIDNVGATVGHMLSSAMYKASRGMGYYGAYLTKFSIDFDLFTKCKVFLSKPFANLKAFTMNSFASQIGLLFIACTLAVVVFLLIKGQVASGMGKLAQIIAVMLIAMFFFTEPLPFLRDANTLAKEFGLAVFEYTQEEADGTDAAVETIWETVAVNPWLLLEFDDMSPSTKAKVENEEKEEYKLLHLKPEEDERKDAADALADTYRPLKSEWSPQSDRMGTAFLLMLMNLVLFLIIVAINLFMLGLQVLTLVLGLITPFVFILALFPSKGMNVIKNWALALLGAYMGIALSLFAYGIFLMLLNLVYGQLMAELGVFLSFVVILSFILMVWVFRRKLLGIFGDTSSLDRFESRAERRMMRMYMHHRHSSSALPAKRVTHTVAQHTERGEGTATERSKSRQRQKAVWENEAQKKGGQMTKRPMDQAGRNMQQEWEDRTRVRTYSDEAQAAYDQREQAEPVQRLDRSERAKQVDNDRRQGDQEGVESTSSTQDVPSRTSNLRKQVRAQVKEEQAGSEPVWKKDAKGIPYRTDSKVGESLRQKVNQGQQKPDHSDRNKEHQEGGIQPKKKHQQELQQKGVQYTGETPVMKKPEANSPLAEYRQGEKAHAQTGMNQADAAEAAPSTSTPRRNAHLEPQAEEKQVIQKPKEQAAASSSEMTAAVKKTEVPSTRVFGEPKPDSHPVASQPTSPAVSRSTGAMETQSTHPSQKGKRRQKQNLRSPLPKQRTVTKPSVHRPVPKGRR